LLTVAKRLHRCWHSFHEMTHYNMTTVTSSSSFIL